MKCLEQQSSYCCSRRVHSRELEGSRAVTPGKAGFVPALGAVTVGVGTKRSLVGFRLFSITSLK